MKFLLHLFCFQIANEILFYNNMSVTLISSDGPQFDLTVEAAKLSVMISNTLDLKGHDEDDDDDEDDSLPANMEPLQLNNIPGETLEKIVEYLKHYVDDPMPEIPQPLPYETFAEVCYSGKTDFVGKMMHVLFLTSPPFPAIHSEHASCMVLQFYNIA